MYRNRGKVPNINSSNNNNNGGYRVPHYSHYRNRNFIIVRYDKTFLAIELISILIMALIIFAVYLFAYKVSFEDPIAIVKNNFLNAQLIALVISIILTGLVTFFTKSSKEKLIRNLRIVAIVSILIVAIFIGIKLNMDSKYNEDTFGEFYEQYEQPNNKNLNKISLSLSGLKISSLKESYIDESINAYTNFSVKAILYMIIHVIFIMVILYLSHRLANVERKKEQLAKNDAILYDDEENVKF